MLRWAGAAMLMALSTPALAEDWVFVTVADDASNITFIDRDSIRDTGATTRASMFSMLSEPDDGGANAFRFELEVDCAGRRSRMVGYEIFDTAMASQGAGSLENEWQPLSGNSQGATIGDFICGKGKLSAQNVSAGHALPFDAARTMLADHAAGKTK